jgi:hypothetical protein
MITFDRKKGKLFYEDGTLLAAGIWAGNGAAHNDPSKECEKMTGPLPDGIYKIGKPYKHKTLGPFVMNLDMIEGDACGRSLFRIHGDNSTPAQWDASHGCIIAGKLVRVEIDKLTDRRVKVI